MTFLKNMTKINNIPEENVDLAIIVAMDNRDETRRWLLEIVNELEIEIPENDTNLSVQESWRVIVDSILSEIKEIKK